MIDRNTEIVTCSCKRVKADYQLCFSRNRSEKEIGSCCYGGWNYLSGNCCNETDQATGKNGLNELNDRRNVVMK